MKIYKKILSHKVTKDVSKKLQEEFLSNFLGYCPVIVRRDGHRPYIDGGPWFSVSHSQNIFMVAISHKINIGLDLELINPKLEYKKLANKFFTQKENENLTLERFYEIWCKKEAVIKYHGGGISLKNCLTDCTLKFEKFYLSKNALGVLAY